MDRPSKGQQGYIIRKEVKIQYTLVNTKIKLNKIKQNKTKQGNINFCNYRNKKGKKTPHIYFINEFHRNTD
jgi:hypothetical protein